MKIGIVTIIGEYNYGNLLQSYALQTTLQRLGHKPITFNRRRKSPPITLHIIRIISYLRSLISRYIFGRNNRLIVNPFSETYNPKSYTDKTELERFVKEYIKRTKPLRSTQAMQKYAKDECFDVIIVGSDQTWREGFVESIEEMFLSFLPNNSNEKRIAYAASFGMDEDYITQEKMPVCIDLIKKFDAVSVREKSAVNICKDKFNIKATHVLDPTMLLVAEDYKKIINQYPISSKNKGDLLVYVLDNTNNINQTIEYITAQNNLISFNVNIARVYNNKSYAYKYPPVEHWLKGFNDAKYVITDSFHGTVFSIIFNKPFICLGNAARGSARFDSLLEMFGLKNRLVDDYSKIEEIMNTPIEWKRVNYILNEKRKEAIDFLQKTLCH